MQTPRLGDNPRRSQFAAFGTGDRFLMNVLVEDTKPRAITVIQNWPSLLKHDGNSLLDKLTDTPPQRRPH